MDSRQYSPTGFGILPPVVKNLIILNVLFFIATLVAGQFFHTDLNDLLGLHYFASQKFAAYQFVTYMFMHGGFGHIFFNMFALWMFGSVLEQVWGPRRFLLYYFVTGIGAALFHYIIFYFQIHPAVQLMDTFLNHPSLDSLNQLVADHAFVVNGNTGEIQALFPDFQKNMQLLSYNSGNAEAMQGAINFVNQYKESFLDLPVVVGASGAIYGLLLAFGMMFPNAMVYVYFFIPMKAKWFVIIFGAIELISGLMETGDNVAHFAHLGGMLFGLILILFWRKRIPSGPGTWIE